MSYKTYEQYVDSNINWIGKIPEHWNITPLKRFVILHNGKEITNEVEADDENAIGVYGSGGLFKYTDEYLFKGESVLFGRKGTLGKPLYLNDIFWTVDTMYYLSFNKYLLPKYCYYCLISYPWDKISTETAKPSVVGTDVTNSMFAIPNIVEQKQITNYLDKKTAKIDATIAKNEELIQLLEEKRVALINQVVTKGLNPDVLMKDSGIEWIGEIPEHWTKMKLKDISTKIGDGLHSTPKYEEDTDYYFINGNNLENGEIKFFENTREVPKEEYEKYKIDLNNQTVLISLNGTIGNLSLFNNEKVILGKSAGYVNLKNDVNKYYVFYQLQSCNILSYFHKELSGTTIKNLSLDTLKHTKILLPPLEEQKQIANYLFINISRINKTIDKIHKNITLLEEYKTSLIHHVVTGKIDVRGEEI